VWVSFTDTISDTVQEKYKLAEISFGEWLKRQRKARGLTQEKLSQQIGCSTITLRKIEAEERRPSEQISNRIAIIFDIPQDQQENFVRFARGNWDVFSAIVQADSWQGSKSFPSNLPASITSFIGVKRKFPNSPGT
jgi:transcriptional regulator with XRE-family HTH domain